MVVGYEQQKTGCDANSQPDVIHVAERFCLISMQRSACNSLSPLNDLPGTLRISRVNFPTGVGNAQRGHAFN